MKLPLLVKRKKEILMMSIIAWVTLAVSQELHYQKEIVLFCLILAPGMSLCHTAGLSAD